MTGRRMGFCTGHSVPGYTSAPGGGGGFGGGGRRGHRNMYYATGLYGWQRASYVPAAPAAMDKEQEIETLKRQAEFFGSQIEAISQRIAKLEKEG